MITYDCYECQEEFTEENPKLQVENPYGPYQYCCKQCADNYNGPDDDYYESFAESYSAYECRQEQQLRDAGRI